MSEYDTLMQITRFGDANQVEERITFFPGKSFDGASFSVTPSTTFNGTGRLVRSYYFTGPNSWMHKFTQNAEEREECHSPEEDVVQRGYGFTYNVFADRHLGWVQYGCNETTNPISTIIPHVSTRTSTTEDPTTVRTSTTTPTKNSETGGGSRGLPRRCDIFTLLLVVFGAFRV